MGRFTKNAVAGKVDEARSGWRARQEKARLRSSNAKMNRAEIAAARAAHLNAARAAEEKSFNPEVTAEAGDFVSALSDVDLVALYRQLHDNRPPAPKAKRKTVERAVRTRLAERAAQEPQGEPDLTYDDDDGSI